MRIDLPHPFSRRENTRIAQGGVRHGGRNPGFAIPSSAIVP
jgi:hypothetical protein